MGSSCSGLSRGRGRTYDQSYSLGAEVCDINHATVVQATATDTATQRLGKT